MTPKQKEKLDQLEDELGVTRGTLPDRGISREGYAFTEVQGITVLIARKSSNPRGGYMIPAVRTYTERTSPSNLDAAVRAKELFEKQTPDSESDYGHLSPLINTDWKCGNQTCRCNRESYQRRLERSLGYRVGLSKA